MADDWYICVQNVGTFFLVFARCRRFKLRNIVAQKNQLLRPLSSLNEYLNPLETSTTNLIPFLRQLIPSKSTMDEMELSSSSLINL